jgi:predicted nucleic acid-binding protein
MKAIADTGFLVAFARERDAHHQWARGVAENITEPLLTCEAVLAEATFHLASAQLVMSFQEEGMVRIAFQMAEHFPRLKELAIRYQDRRPDLADLCLIRMSEIYPKYSVVTTDVNDFRVYRRGQRERIPLIHP